MELSTAWSEYNQGLVQHPGLVVRLHVAGLAASLPDARDPALREAFGIPDDLGANDWRAAQAQYGEAPTQSAAERLITAGHPSLLYPSAMSPGGACAVLWRWNEPDALTITVEDLEGRLPRDARSWGG